MKTSARSRNVTRRIIITTLLSPSAPPVIGGRWGGRRPTFRPYLGRGRRYHMIITGRYPFSLRHRRRRQNEPELKGMST